MSVAPIKYKTFQSPKLEVNYERPVTSYPDKEIISGLRGTQKPIHI
jgi:hypothetical protein